MNGPHDLGGRDGFGPIAPEKDEPLFHAPWERRALGVTLAAGAMGHWTIDESRAAREDRHPLDYYGSTYYEIWIKALERLLLRHRLVSEAELTEGRAIERSAPPKRVLMARDVAAALARGGPVNRDPGGRRPAFAPGDRVRTLNLQPRGHTRLPTYVFADRSAKGEDGAAAWLYTVAFEARALWGAGAPAADVVSVDAWEPYLERA